MLQLRFVGIEKPPVWLVDETYIIGAGAGCHIQLTDPSVKPRHAQLSVRDEVLSISPSTEDGVVIVDGSRIYAETSLSHGAQLALGACHLTIVDPKRERPLTAGVGTTNPSPWVLQSKTAALAHKLFPVERDMIVGRARECDLCLAVAHLSRRHARLFFESGALWVEDLGSANGTFLNGKRLAGRARLCDCDELAFDTLVFVIRGEPVAEPERLDDKTSLRPAIAAAPAGERVSAERRQVGAAVRQSAHQLKPTLQSEMKNSGDERAGHSSAVLWGGVAVAVVLTALAILYFAA